MRKITAREINDLVSKFSAKTLAKGERNHQAHLLTGLRHNMNHDLDTAIDLMRAKIQDFNTSMGTPNLDAAGYHETLTIF